MTQPVAIVDLENAISLWLRTALGDAVRVYFPAPRDEGAPLPAPPSCQIYQLTPDVRLARDAITPLPSIMQQRVTVTAGGPGEAGVAFRLGTEEAPTLISVALLAGDDPEAGAVKLLAELDSELPAGVTASADPEDPASVLVVGSESEPLFSCAPTGLASVFTVIERSPKLHAGLSRITWRVQIRTLAVTGFETAWQLMSRAKRYIDRVLRLELQRVGWLYKGSLLDTSTIPATRQPGTATFDFAIEGFATIIFQDPALRFTRTVYGPN